MRAAFAVAFLLASPVQAQDVVGAIMLNLAKGSGFASLCGKPYDEKSLDMICLGYVAALEHQWTYDLVMGAASSTNCRPSPWQYQDMRMILVNFIKGRPPQPDYPTPYLYREAVDSAFPCTTGSPPRPLPPALPRY